MNIENQIAGIILKRRQSGKRFVVAVCGAADLGKSYLSAGIVSRIHESGVKAGCLPMDAFLIDRADRIKEGISGYNPAACNLLAVEHQIWRFAEGGDVVYSPYDHHTGKNRSENREIIRADILIVEGLHSMHELLMPRVGLSLFVFTGDSRLRRLRREADIVKRKHTPEFSKAVEPEEFRQYKRWVAPYREKADIGLFLEKRWQYTIEQKPEKNRTND